MKDVYRTPDERMVTSAPRLRLFWPRLRRKSSRVLWNVLFVMVSFVSNWIEDLNEF